MIHSETAYLRFLDRAAHLLTVAGARTVALETMGGGAPPGWTDGWDRVLVSDDGGSASVYAFTDAQHVSTGELVQRVDTLVAGLAALGMLHGPPLRLVVIAVFPQGLGTGRPRAVTGITPRYLPGLRPSVWAADLQTGTLHRGRLSREGAHLIAAALRPASPEETVDTARLDRLERENADRTAAFYRLMRSRPPVVSYTLLSVNILMFALMYLHGSPQSDATLREFGALSPRLILQGQWWRLCTAIFLHAGVAHILFNMISLFAIGPITERLYGSTRFLAIYLGAGLLGSVSSFTYAVLMNNLDVLGVGASGAIFGLAGALIAIRFQRSDIIPLRLRQRISTSLIPLVVLNLFVASVTPHVDNSAHLGGLIGGILLSMLLPVTRRTDGVR